jgi:AraC-like DNA-binding protein
VVSSVPEALAPYVGLLSAHRTDPDAPELHRGLPSTTLTLVLSIGRPLDVGWADGSARKERWSTVSGLHAGPAAIHQSGVQQGVQLGLTTAGARALLGVPAAELAHELLELEDVAPALVDLPERLHDAGLDDAVRVVTEALTEALARHGEAAPRAEVGRALTGLTRGERVADVAGEVGYSRRRLSTLVREETGLAPKEYQRVARFQASRAMVGRRPLAEVAAVCGYADQGHLARDWSELAGCPPSTWLREEFPFLRDQEDRAAAW